MNSIVAVPKFEGVNEFVAWNGVSKAHSFKDSIQTNVHLAGVVGRFPLQQFRYAGDQQDRKWPDYLLIVGLSILLHSVLVGRIGSAQLSDDLEQPPKPLKVSISFAHPQPPKPVPPPLIQPKPPVQKAVPLRPQSPKPSPKVVQQEPQLSSAPVVDSTPVVTAPAAPVAAPVEETITPPVAGAAYLHNPPPEYPELAQENGWEGKVLLKVHVLPDGHPDNVGVMKTSGQRVLDDAAVKTVYKWSFVPAKRGETAVAGWVTVPITFNLS
jgi:periplasmic protein TonB